MDDDVQFDEFGNAIGDKGRAEPPAAAEKDDELESVMTEDYRQSIVLPEHRQLFPSALETFGPEVEALVFDEDTQALDEPIVKPKEGRSFVGRPVLGDFPYSDEFLRQVVSIPGRNRNVAVVGPMHAGKTTVLDMLIEGAYGESLRGDRILDHWSVEQERGVTLSAKPFTVLLKDARGASNAVTLIDSPGHADFGSEQQAAMELADVIVLVVDALEGVVMTVRETVKRLAKHAKPVVLFINKVDRLILEAKLPPADAYFKLKHLVDVLNSDLPDKLHPELGAVVFGSALHRWCFTLQSFCDRFYADMPAGLAHRLFGEVFYDPASGEFRKSGDKRTFVQFVLDPIYKVYTSVISTDDPERVVCVSKRDKLLDIKPLVKKAASNTIGWDYDFLFAHHITRDTASSSTLAVAAKGLPFEQQEIGFLVKIVSGSVGIGQDLAVLTEPHSEARKCFIKVSRLFLYQGSHGLVPLRLAVPGTIVYIQSADLASSIDYPLFVLCSPDHPPALLHPHLMDMQRKRQSGRPVTVKIGIEPLLPANLPRMQEAVRRARQCFGRAVEYRVEETGEHTLIGPGELLMDLVMCQLRGLFSAAKPIEIRVSDPTVVFCETVVDGSSVTCYADTPNGRASVSMLAEPLEMGLSEDLEEGLLSGRIGDPLSLARVGAVLMDRYGWDVLAARSIVAVGPDPDFGPNVLLNDILPGGLPISDDHLGCIIQAFQWTCRQGPLVEAPVRGVKFRLVDFAVKDGPQPVQSGQLIPTVRKACFAAMITATAKLMEPVLQVETVCPLACKEIVFEVLGKRRGHVTSDEPLPGTPFYAIVALVPAIDSYGLECDLRIACQGQAAVQSIMALWQPVPGDPMDTAIKVPPLTAAPASAMSRDFIQKTRRRKGLAEDVKVERFLDDRMLRAMNALNI